MRKEFAWQSNTWVQTNEVRYVYNGNLVLQERDVNNLPLVTYTRGPDLSGTIDGAGGIGGLLARTDNGVLAIGSPSAHAYYHPDANGNVTCLINSNQLNYVYTSRPGRGKTTEKHLTLVFNNHERLRCGSCRERPLERPCGCDYRCRSGCDRPD